MHKRPFDLRRLFPLVLLSLLLSFTSPASAAGLAGPAGPEQLSDFDDAVDTPRTAWTRQTGYAYEVQPGDDVWLIAVSHGITMDELVGANDLAAPYWIHPGDWLWVPAEPAVVKRKARPSEAPLQAPQPAPPPSAEALPQPDAIQPSETVSNTAAALPPASAPITATAPAAPAEPVAAPPAAVAATGAAPEAVAASQPAPASIPEWAALILALTNEKRAANGLPALAWSAELAQAAQAHADDCAQRGWGSHVGSDGARLRTRYARVGYSASWASENWANARDAQQAFDMWWFEPAWGPHRLNILGPNYTEVGIGIAQGGWGYYFIADFGRR